MMTLQSDNSQELAKLGYAEARLASLDACDVMDTAREPMFDNVVFTVAQLLRGPIAALILVGDGREWSKADVGPLKLHWDRAALMARTVVETGEMLVLENAQADARFPGPFPAPSGVGARVSMVAPVIGPDRYRIGALCVLDSQVRPALNRQVLHFQQLADQAGELLRLRVAGLDLEAFRFCAR